ncbi:addiction module antidote protein [Labrys sp. ZIDIC5]|uniref:addiction module antidote protein n=1 Tax=Labrys sedimenti TaxID=3106036 RepID=UPI002ACA59C3|nr:addiction module antidote protein [Labrys sp. ZIDIC5]MDZ5448260.1 addiction module antidote protein [Labrys sp. ZIDIC5]
MKKPPKATEVRQEHTPSVEELLARFPELKPYDIGDYLETDEDIEAAIAVGLEAVAEDRDQSFLNNVLGAVLKRQNIDKLSKETGLSRETLYTLSTKSSDPRLSTLSTVLGALGYTITIKKRDSKLEPA